MNEKWKVFIDWLKGKHWWNDSERSLAVIVRSAIIGSIVLILVPWRWFNAITIGGYKFFDIDKFGELGDFISGITAPILGLVTILLLFRTYRTQKQELEDTKNALRSQQASSSLFNMIGTLENILKTAKGIVPYVTDDPMQDGKRVTKDKDIFGREVMNQHAHALSKLTFYVNLYYEYDITTWGIVEYKLELNEPTSKNSPLFNKIPTGKTFTVNDYIEVHLRPKLKEYFKDQDNSFLTVLHYIEAITKFIATQFATNEERRFYGSVFASQFSSEELVVIFYYSLSGLKPDLNQRLTRMLFFDNMIAADLASENHLSIYRHRIFTIDMEKW